MTIQGLTFNSVQRGRKGVSSIRMKKRGHGKYHGELKYPRWVMKDEWNVVRQTLVYLLCNYWLGYPHSNKMTSVPYSSARVRTQTHTQ